MCLILGACVINSSLANGLIGKSDASALFTAIVVVVVIFYMAVPLYWSALVADAVLLGYASLTLTREDMLVAVPALLIADTVFIRTLRYPAIRSPLIAALHIGVGTPLVASRASATLAGRKTLLKMLKKRQTSLWMLRRRLGQRRPTRAPTPKRQARNASLVSLSKFPIFSARLIIRLAELRVGCLSTRLRFRLHPIQRAIRPRLHPKTTQCHHFQLPDQTSQLRI